MKTLEQLIQIATSAKEDAEKFYDKGNSAAGTRLRKSMQEIKKLAQDIRTEVSAKKNG